ncbi:MAG: outer membrane protein transport protein [Vicinamibacteraceae bacterium]|nr:outer membrane protein transport protein [Vicinamibacteraceae bacterium]
MVNRHTILMGAAVLAALALAPSRAAAQGYGVYEQSACMLGAAGAGVASPCLDGSAIYFNPAALTDVEGKLISLGGALIGPRGTFVNATTGVETDMRKAWYPVPSGYYAQRLNDRTVVGLGLFVPYGLTSEWPLSFEGRFLAYKSMVQAPYIQPTIAYKVNDRVSVGGGFDVVIAKLQLKQRVDLSRQAIPGTPFTFFNLGVPRGTDFADVDLEGHDLGYGFHLGTLIKANDRVSIGARFMSRVKISTDDGDIRTEQILTGLRTPIPLGPTIPAGTPLDALVAPNFQAGARLSDQKVATEITLPDQLVVGVAVQATDRVEVLADYVFVNWSTFDVLEVNGSNGLESVSYEDYRDTHGIRLGTRIDINDRVTGRLGFVAHSAAAPDQTVTPLLPEAKRTWYSAGLGLKVTEAVHVDAFYIYLNQVDREGRTTDGGLERPTAAVNNGTYEFHGNLVGAALVWKF